MKLKSIEQKQTIFDFNTSFSTRNHLLKLNKVESNDVKYRLKDQLILVDIPNDSEVKSLDIQQKIYCSRQLVDSLKRFLSEMRQIIGDVDLIRLTDNIFQRSQLREIQKKADKIQNQYQLIFNKIE